MLPIEPPLFVQLCHLKQDAVTLLFVKINPSYLNNVILDAIKLISFSFKRVTNMFFGIVPIMEIRANNKTSLSHQLEL